MNSVKISSPIFPLLSLLMGVGWGLPVIANDFDVWLVDQSNSKGLGYGGKIYLYEGSDLIGDNLSNVAPSSIIDLAGETDNLCFSSTGAHAVRPHMLLFNSTYSHAVLSFVASGHVAIFDAASRTPVACLRTMPGLNGVRQAHAAFPALDNSYILVANQNGKLLERIDTDYENNIFTLNPAATINLATCTTANGKPCQQPEVRPDNAPICPMLDSSSNLGFITLRGGGMFVVDPKANPMKILAEYDMGTVHPNGCGGIEAKGNMYINSGGGTPSNISEFDVYKFPLGGYNQTNPPNTPKPLVVFSDDNGSHERDSHGMILSQPNNYLWVNDRLKNVIEVISVDSDSRVNTIDLLSSFSSDPAPDLMDISPSGNQVFVSLRGPNPLSGDPHASTGTTPGLMVIDVLERGRNGKVKGIIPISNFDANNVQRADAHGIRVRRKTKVPEPTSALSFLALGLLGLAVKILRFCD